MSDVASIIEQETELVSRFIDLLRKEQICLTQAEPELLGQISEDKEPLIKSLNDLEALRNKELGITEGRSSLVAMDNWLALSPKNASATVHWQILLKLAAAAKAMNEINNQLVKLHLAKTNAALNILSSDPNSRDLYGRNGHAFLSTGSRIVDSA